MLILPEQPNTAVPFEMFDWQVDLQNFGQVSFPMWRCWGLFHM